MFSENDGQEQGLTGIEEKIRGFVGRRNLKFTSTQTTYRPCLTFDLCSDRHNTQANRAPIWRHCIVYGILAEQYKEQVRAGALIRAIGWLIASYQKDSDGKYILQNGEPMTVKNLIVEEMEILRPSNDRQMSFSSAGRLI